MKKDRKKKVNDINSETTEENFSDIEFVEEADTESSFNNLDARSLVKKLKKKIALLEKERGENLIGWQRAKADYVNLKKRGAEQVERVQGVAREDTVRTFLPILDSFEVAMQGKVWAEASEAWRKGFESIYKQFVTALTENGVEEAGMIGEVFDPHLHTSVSIIEVDNSILDGTVAEVLQKGYRFNSGEVIRSPKVVVYAYEQKEEITSE